MPSFCYQKCAKVPKNVKKKTFDNQNLALNYSFFLTTLEYRVLLSYLILQIHVTIMLNFKISHHHLITHRILRIHVVKIMLNFKINSLHQLMTKELILFMVNKRAACFFNLTTTWLS